VTAAAHRHTQLADPLGIAWLPAGGLGNGLTADAWAPVLDVDARLAVTLLDLLAAAGVAGYAAPTRHRLHASWRLWVATSRYATAEAVLLRAMPALLRRDPNGLR
jgi:hypothetical protein